MRTEEALPPKVTRAELREHFRSAYNLSEEQIEVMLESSSSSLQKSFSMLYDLLGDSQDLKEITRIGHSLKGLLLNMGQERWAQIAREMEKSAAAGEQRGYRAMADAIYEGVREIL